MNLRQRIEAKKLNISEANLKSKHSNSILHLNVRSINKHLEELEILIDELESPPLCVCLSETWLNAGSPNEIYKLKGYSGVIAKPRDKKSGGGVMIQLREDVQLVKKLRNTLSRGTMCENLSLQQKLYCCFDIQCTRL